MSTEKTWTGERLEPGVFNETTIEHLHRYAFVLEYTRGKKVLDIACGEGYGSALLARSAAHVTGVDIDKESVNSAKRKYNIPNLSFIEGSVEKIPSEDHVFDTVVCFETLEHVAIHEILLKEITRVLKPGGLVIISTPDRKNYTEKTGRNNPFHVKELNRLEFEMLLKMFYRNVVIVQQQIAFSSVISGDKAEGFTSYAGDFSEVYEEQEHEGLYNIALASDAVLPRVKNSLFNGKSVFAEAVSEKENQVINTITYKLGHVLLYPAKMIRRIFKKQ